MGISGAAFAELGYKPCKAEPDVYMRVAIKKNGEKYYQYMIAYVDDLLCCGEDPGTQMKMIEGKATLKDGSVEDPTLHLGSDIESILFMIPLNQQRSVGLCLPLSIRERP